MSAALIAARKDAIARGDKALGREIYHQLIEAGYRPEDIDADTFTNVGVERNVEPAAVDAPETTQAPEAPEVAVKPAAKRRTKSDE